MSSVNSSDNLKMSASAKPTKTSASKTVKAAEPVVAAPVVAAKAEKAPKAKAEKAVKAEVAAPAPAAVVAPVEAAAEEDVGASLQKTIAELHEQLTGPRAVRTAAEAAGRRVGRSAASGRHLTTAQAALPRG